MYLCSHIRSDPKGHPCIAATWISSGLSRSLEQQAIFHKKWSNNQSQGLHQQGSPVRSASHSFTFIQIVNRSICSPPPRIGVGVDVTVSWAASPISFPVSVPNRPHRKSNQLVGAAVDSLRLVELSGFINTVNPIHRERSSKRTTMFDPGQSALECGVTLVGNGFHWFLPKSPISSYRPISV